MPTFSYISIVVSARIGSFSRNGSHIFIYFQARNHHTKQEKNSADLNSRSVKRLSKLPIENGISASYEVKSALSPCSCMVTVEFSIMNNSLTNPCFFQLKA